MIQQPAQTILTALPLEGLRVGISGAVPERMYWDNVPDLDRLILAFVAQLSALVIRFGGDVVHGSQPLFAPVIAEQARGQSHDGKTSLRLFASQLFGDLPEVTARAARMAHAEVLLTRQVGQGDSRDRKTRNDSLTAMRLAMIQEIDVLVAIGGKLHMETGFNPGVLEELANARWHGVPCFAVASFGGAAGKLDHSILEEISADNLLGTGTMVSMLDMATWTDSMDEYVGKLMAHLARHKEQFSKSAQIRPRSKFRIQRDALVETSSVLTRVLSVDPIFVDARSTRFANLMRAIEKQDTSQARKILSGTHFLERT